MDEVARIALLAMALFVAFLIIVKVRDCERDSRCHYACGPIHGLPLLRGYGYSCGFSDSER